MSTAQAAMKAASLTDAQRQYLRLVAQGMTSKQIAQTLGGSHHTINVQIGVAMRILGVTSRRDAAAMLEDGAATASYEPSYDPPPVADPAAANEGSPQETRSGGDQQWAIPVSTKARPLNTLGVGRRLVWILVIAVGVALLLGGLVSGVTTMLTSLGRLT